MSLTERQVNILEMLCRSYIERAFPISSQFLKDECNFSFSSATIRNEFLELEKKHYLRHPNISSGRVPTDKGYRFFVNKFLEKSGKKNHQLKPSQEKILKNISFKLKYYRNAIKISYQAAKILSYLSSNLALIYLSNKNIFWKEGLEIVVKQPEFNDTSYLRKFFANLGKFEKNIDKFNCGEGEVKVYIGKENPFKAEISVVAAKAYFPENIEGLVAILGPERMDFEKNIDLVNSLVKVLKKFN